MKHQKSKFIQSLNNMDYKQKLKYFRHQRKQSKNKVGWDLIIASELLIQKCKKNEKQN